MREQQNIHTLTKSQVSELSSRHIRGVDKWYRMFAGCASTLVRYENGIIYLNVENTEKYLLSDYETAVKFVRSWVNFNKELAHARGFIVCFYKTGITGFMLSLAQAKPEALKDICDQFKAAEAKEPQLVNIFSGLIADISNS
jgi:hypothetical protein